MMASGGLKRQGLLGTKAVRWQEALCQKVYEALFEASEACCVTQGFLTAALD